MKTPFIFCFFLLAFAVHLPAQKISKAEAKQLLVKTLDCLKTNDTAAFVNMWYFDDTPRPYDKTIFAKQDAVEEFIELKKFLDTALTQNLPFDAIDVEKMSSFGKYKVKYKIKGWFKYDEKLKYYKGYGFLADYINKQWLFRFTVERSTSYRS
jgi:hypothetical protein